MSGLFSALFSPIRRDIYRSKTDVGEVVLMVVVASAIVVVAMVVIIVL